MHKRQLLEFTLLTILLLSGICVNFKVPYFKYGIAFSGFFLGILYFNLGFWLFAKFSISLVNRIIAGLFFAVNILDWMFCLLNWPLWNLYAIISFIGLPLIIIICVINRQKTDYKQLLFRSIFFLIVLTMIYSYRRFSS